MVHSFITYFSLTNGLSWLSALSYTGCAGVRIRHFYEIVTWYVTFVACQSVEEIEDPLGYTRSRDLFNLGVTFAQMLFGEVWLRFDTPALCIEGSAYDRFQTADPNSFLNWCRVNQIYVDQVPNDYPLICQDLLTSLLFHHRKVSADAIESKLEAFHRLKKDSKSGMVLTQPYGQTCFWLLGQELTLTKPAMIAPAPVSRIRRDVQPSFSTSIPEQKGIFWQPQAAALFSRYRNDFEEVEFLGKIVSSFMSLCDWWLKHWYDVGLSQVKAGSAR